MKVGFTLDEKSFNIINPNSLLEKAKKSKINSIEMSPDKNVLSINTYMDIAKKCKSLDIEINFHVPYFANSFFYEIMNIKEYPKEIKDQYMEFIDIIRDIQDITAMVPTIVFHGAEYIGDSNISSGLYNTLIFFDWLLNHTVKKGIQINMALETLSKKEKRVIGDNREEALFIINEFKKTNFGICWDMCHDSMNYYPGKEMLSNDFYEKIIYTHIHGIKSDSGPNHISIKNSFLDFNEELTFLKLNEYDKVINVELLVDNCGDTYLEDLFNDIDYLNSFKDT